MKTALASLAIALAGSVAAWPKPAVPVLNLTAGGLTTAHRAAVALEGRAAPLRARRTPKNECIPKWSILFDKYTVHGVDFDFFGEHGERLEHELQGCAGLGDFTFARGAFGATDQYTWESTFRLALGQRTCVGHALQTLGGQMSSCHN